MDKEQNGQKNEFPKAPDGTLITPDAKVENAFMLLRQQGVMSTKETFTFLTQYGYLTVDNFTRQDPGQIHSRTGYPYGYCADIINRIRAFIGIQDKVNTIAPDRPSKLPPSGQGRHDGIVGLDDYAGRGTTHIDNTVINSTHIINTGGGPLIMGGVRIENFHGHSTRPNTYIPKETKLSRAQKELCREISEVWVQKLIEQFGNLSFDDFADLRVSVIAQALGLSQDSAQNLRWYLTEMTKRS